MDQIRRNNSQRGMGEASDEIQERKLVAPTEEIYPMPQTPKDIITAVARGYQRSLRPPGQPLRFG